MSAKACIANKPSSTLFVSPSPGLPTPRSGCSQDLARHFMSVFSEKPMTTSPRQSPSAYSALRIRKAAVLGAGVMGAQIAAHLTNAGVETVLFDLPAKEGPKS